MSEKTKFDSLDETPDFGKEHVEVKEGETESVRFTGFFGAREDCHRLVDEGTYLCYGFTTRRDPESGT